MTDGMKSGIIGAIVGAILTGVISVGLFIAEKDSIEKKTVETLSGYFESVDKDMSYDQVLKFIYEDSKKLKDENDNLKNELNTLEVLVDTDETNKTTIEDAKSFANTNDFAKALLILNGVEKRTSEMEVLLNDYTQKYETQIMEQADIFKSDDKFDEAAALLNEALKMLPNSQSLKDKSKEIEDSYPKNMTDVVPAYQSGGNPYHEYSALKSGSTEYFIMGGKKYTNGMTFDADIYPFNDDISWAVYNLDSNYTSLGFTVCHVDGTDIGKETSLQIFYDGVLKEEIPLAPDMSPKAISLDVSGVVQLKMLVHSSGSYHP